ncbi:MFS transporter [Roseovarius sp. SCSIO 43702]|uniref:MFS transporter n=1 Tax=Roseovarius sp. SCSIO 43702 TaxID=2823043 RepID=UPI001C72E9EE|nr:MFS transporter [Roseovarius sp. SCSIO 43702]QYX57348.1 MFS transporter [Roseovarius sp. SCSIO 43702]
MKRAILDNWALFLGMLGLMVANGLLVTLLSIRGASLGFSPLTISLMQACYPLGALIGTIAAPHLIEKVGHIRVFSAFASMVSVAAIAHLLTDDPWSWSAMRFLAGVCFPGLYVVTESWLNAKSENRIRAQVLSIYFIIQTVGPAVGTAMVGLPDPTGNMLFGLASILLSVAIVPLLLSNNRAPEYSAPDRMTVRRLYRVSPMAVLGIVIMSVGVSAWFVGLPLYALELGLSEQQASGALVLAMGAAGLSQYPVGWISDRTDRRLVVMGLCILTALAAMWMALDQRPLAVFAGFGVIAAMSLPVYSILAAHANDQLQPGQVVAASGAMAFLMQFGQVFGMFLGPNMIALFEGRGLPALVAVTSLVVVGIAVMRRARSDAPEDTGEFVPTGVLGVAQPGMFQAEYLAEEEETTQESSGHSDQDK